jgi:hypothetical protein
MASTRVSDYFESGKWPQFMINILNVAFIPIVINLIAFFLPLWRYTATKKKTGSRGGDREESRDGQFFRRWLYPHRNRNMFLL